MSCHRRFGSLRSCLAILAFFLPCVPLSAAVTPTGPEVRVSLQDESRQRLPAAGVRKDGKDGFLLVWEDDYLGVLGRFMAPTGAGVGAAFVLAPSDPLPPLPFYGRLKEHGEPAIALEPDATFLLVWVEKTVDRGVDIFVNHRSVVSTRVLGRRFAANGKPLAGAAGNPFEIAKRSVLPSRPAVVATADGGFWIVWEESGPGGIHLRRLDAKGKLGRDIRLTRLADARPSPLAATASWSPGKTAAARPASRRYARSCSRPGARRSGRCSWCPPRPASPPQLQPSQAV